ncbi:psbP domain-containing protein 3 chloroplastic isoform X1 [Prunus yedoensis var. nudiflora]|uniref:PsbP domain-containing protein 3 chloroplastic isoform X1 n=1 Tax=Prunus yedoensis var. nudiflora TaxID=2094558 RepID=A0A314UBJ6_PRUYE|nr:psbP domain-containing protein 3 chloroplastic isoform X1 [Prunus yedoensis var. nudiflora]
MAHDNIAEKNEVTNKAGRRQSERHGVRCVFVFSAPAATSVEQHRNKEPEPEPERIMFRHSMSSQEKTSFAWDDVCCIFVSGTYFKALAENDVPVGFRIYTDDVNKFKILIPQDWQVGAGEPTGFKSVTAFYPEEGYSSISVVITGLGPDFTKMESFGKVEAFAETLVSGLDRSWQRPAGVTAKLIDCKSKGLYFIEYSLQKPGESVKHLFSALGMATNGWYNRLYTVTGQYVEEESDKYSSNIAKAVKSFEFI